MTQKSHFWVISKGNKITMLKKYLYSYVYCNIIHSIQGVETIHMSISGLMDLKNYIYMCVCVCMYKWYPALKKNEVLPFAITWIDLEDIMLSELSQRQINIA